MEELRKGCRMLGTGYRVPGAGTDMYRLLGHGYWLPGYRVARVGWIEIHPYHIGRAYSSLETYRYQVPLGTTDMVATDFNPLTQIIANALFSMLLGRAIQI